MSDQSVDSSTTSRAWLDEQYNVRAGIPDHEAIFESWEKRSAAVRSESRLETISYGDDPAQEYDLFLPDAGSASGLPVLIFIHGGYWQSLDKSFFSYLAPAYTSRGVCFAALNYRLAPQASMDEIVADVRDGVRDLARRSPDLGIDPTRIYIAGHSAGGHLTAMMLAVDWTRYGLAADLVKGACTVSGLYDLEPISRCYLNEKIAMSTDDARRHSPVHLRPGARSAMIVTYGGDESSEFDRQQGEIVRLWSRHCSSITVIGMSDGHHFDAVDRLAGEHALHRSVLAMIGVAT